MAEARCIGLSAAGQRAGGFELVVISPNDPAAMLRHTAECREHGYAFAADPSQQLARSDGGTVQDLVDGDACLFSNEYAIALSLLSARRVSELIPYGDRSADGHPGA